MDGAPLVSLRPVLREDLANLATGTRTGLAGDPHVVSEALAPYLNSDWIVPSLGVALVCLLVVLLGHNRRKRREGHPRSVENRTRPDVSEPSIEAIAPPPFDAKTAHPPEPSTSVIVGRARIVDGDTIVIRKTQIRLFGIDAPEANHPYGQKAKWALVSLCKGKSIRAEVSDEDAYGRTVARCFLEDGRDLSAEMVKIGMAIDWRKYSGGIYRRFETEDARKKLWLADARQKGRMHVWRKYEQERKATHFSR